MADDTFRKHCWLATVLVAFGMLLALRGMGLHKLMSTSEVRWFLSVMIFIAIIAIFVFMYFFDKYLSGDDERPVTSAEGQPIQRRDGYQPINNNTTYNSMGTTQSKKTAVVYLEKSKSKINAIPHFLARHSHVMAVYIFGGGGVILNFCYAFYTSQCVIFFSREGIESLYKDVLIFLKLTEDKDPYGFNDEKTRIISTVAKAIFFAIQIPFLHHLSNLTNTKHKTASQYILLPIMGANFATWLYTFLDETKLLNIYTFDYPDVPYKQNIEIACMNHSTVLEVYIRNTLEKVFYPMSMEFCLTSMEIMYHVYFLSTISKSESDPECSQLSRQQIIDWIKDVNDDVVNRIKSIEFEQVKNDVESTSENVTNDMRDNPCNFNILIMVPDDTDTSIDKTKRQRFFTIIMSLFHPCTALVFGLIEATLMKIFLIHQEVSEDGYIDDNYMAQYIKMPLLLYRISTNCIIPILVIAICLSIIKQFEYKENVIHHVKWSILLGLIGITVTSVFEMAVSIEKLRKESEGERNVHVDTLLALQIFEFFLYWVQYFMQVFLIYHGGRRIANTGHALYDVLHKGLSFLAMLNFIHWGINSFLETEYLRTRVTSDSYNKFWDLLVHLTQPTCIYFRYTCTFLFLEIKQSLSKEENKEQTWKLSMKIEPPSSPI